MVQSTTRLIELTIQKENLHIRKQFSKEINHILPTE
jgi:hypothetical protein